MCIAATTAPTARRRTSLLYEQHKRKAKFRWNVVKLLFALLAVWYVKWTIKTVLEGTDGTYGEMDEDISAASSHRRKNHPVSLQKANEDYASNDDYSSFSSSSSDFFAVSWTTGPTGSGASSKGAPKAAVVFAASAI